MEKINFKDFNDKNLGLCISEKPIEDEGSIKKKLIILTGYLDTNNSTLFTDTIINYLQSYHGDMIIIFDFLHLSYISSTGIGAFTSILTYAKNNNLKLFILNSQEKIKTVFELLGFRNVFNFINNLNEINKLNNTSLKNQECPKCKKLLKISKAGKFKCPSCNSIIIIDKSENIILEE